ncbi:phage terminase small subunit [Halodesulfovibrio aestuarii]|uniref:Phage terminase small subunit n=2 Tax=Halodesulfovibrio aestuarii TaxID=126333 RepID=A0A8G2CB70_9BACT|nr:phage terminase small subunit [Halodesulfovibrio aestuarii]
MASERNSVERERVTVARGEKRTGMKKATNESRKLSAKQQHFIDEYVIDFNGRLAACRAGYAERAALTTAGRLLAMPEVADGIQKRLQELSERGQVTRDAVVRELAAVGFASLRDVCAWDDGHLTLVSSQDLSNAQAASIAEISETVTTRGGTVRVKQHSKLKALEMLAKHVGLYDSPEVEQDGKSLEELSPVLKKRLEAIYGIITDEAKTGG